jgi:hypothetical protein
MVIESDKLESIWGGKVNGRLWQEIDKTRSNYGEIVYY